MNILVFDNYDSFTYNLVHALRKQGINPDVIRNDKIDLDDVARYDKIIISPGPGIPEEAGQLMPLLKRWGAKKPILGVCLGHQAIAQSFGAQLYNLADVYHGIQDEIEVVANDYIFQGILAKMKVGRYHSWAVSSDNLPEELEVTAVDKNGIIMALRHKTLDVRGVQFHPESIMTPLGEKLLNNWLNH